MSTVTVGEMKDGLSSLLSAAEAGETITITRHGKPVAELRPIPRAPEDYAAINQAAMVWLRERRRELPKVKTDVVAMLRRMRDGEEDD